MDGWMGGCVDGQAPTKTEKERDWTIAMVEGLFSTYKALGSIPHLRSKGRVCAENSLH